LFGIFEKGMKSLRREDYAAQVRCRISAADEKAPYAVSANSAIKLFCRLT
jgi:hypothetical protein